MVILILLVGWGITSAVTWPGFHPRMVGVHGTHEVPPALVRAAAQIAPDQNIWLLNPWAVAARVEAIPYIDRVHIERQLPNIVGLAVTERRPESCVRTAHGMMMIDATERVLENTCRTALRYFVPQMPARRPGETLDDPRLQRLRATVVALNTQHMQAVSMSYDRDDGIVAELTGHLRLFLGDDSDQDEKLRLVAPILAAARVHNQPVELLDLRAVDTPVVRYRETASPAQNRSAK